MLKKQFPKTTMVVFVTRDQEVLLPLSENRPPILFLVAGKKIIDWFYDLSKRMGISKIILLSSKQDRNVIYEYLKRYKVGSALHNDEIGPFTIIEFDALKGITKELWINSCLKDLSNYSLWVDGNVIFSEHFLNDFLDKAHKTENYALVSNKNEYLGIGFFSKKILEGLIENTKCVTDILLRANEKDSGALSSMKYINNETHFWKIEYLWNLLDANLTLIDTIEGNNEGIIEEGATIIGKLSLGENSRIRAGSYLEGPIAIGKNCDIGPNCYLRKGVSLGDNVRIGNACEIKNTIVDNGTHIAHLSYVGDSVIGANCNFGAGTMTGNLRLDDEVVNVQVNSKNVSTNRRKLGVIMGDNVKTAINVYFMPGVTIGNNSAIGTGVIVNRNISSEQFVYIEQLKSSREWNISPKKKG